MLPHARRPGLSSWHMHQPLLMRCARLPSSTQNALADRSCTNQLPVTDAPTPSAVALPLGPLRGPVPVPFTSTRGAAISRSADTHAHAHHPNHATTGGAAGSQALPPEGPASASRQIPALGLPPKPHARSDWAIECGYANSPPDHTRI